MGDIAPVVEGDFHCGTAASGQKQEIRYIVKVKCGDALDHRGFLVEQRNIDAHIQKIKRVKSSCELLSQRIARELEVVIRAETPDIDVRWIKVQLIASPGLASMMYKHKC